MYSDFSAIMSDNNRRGNSMLLRALEFTALAVAAGAAWLFYSSSKEATEENYQLRHELRRTRKESGDLRENKPPQGQCSVCRDVIAEVVINPCRHVCVCRCCAEKIMETDRKCPICRGGISTIENIYLS